jgi:hypothetical protein
LPRNVDNWTCYSGNAGKIIYEMAPKNSGSHIMWFISFLCGSLRILCMCPLPCQETWTN